MPVICTKDQTKCYKAITGRVLEKRRTDIEISNQTLKTFSVKNSDTPTSSKFLSGSAIPNSIAKKNVGRKDLYIGTIDEEQELHNISDTVKDQKESLKGDLTKTFDKQEKRENSSQNSSIVSGSEKLMELQELHKQLQKSYEPKPLFAPRRPTLESIKSAIEKAKQEYERNKNVGTDDDFKSVTMSDASTLTDKIKKKSKKKTSPRMMQVSTSNFSPTVNGTKTKNAKNITVDIKLNKRLEKLS